MGYSFARRDPKKRDDYVACAYLGLVKGCTNLVSVEHANTEAYIVTMCKHECYDFACMIKGRAPTVSLAEASETVPAPMEDVLDKFTITDQKIMREKMAGCTDEEISVILDYAVLFEYNDRETKVAAMAVSGMSDRAIAAALGISNTQVNNIMKEIKRKTDVQPPTPPSNKEGTVRAPSSDCGSQRCTLTLQQIT